MREEQKQLIARNKDQIVMAVKKLPSNPKGEITLAFIDGDSRIQLDNLRSSGSDVIQLMVDEVELNYTEKEDVLNIDVPGLMLSILLNDASKNLRV